MDYKALARQTLPYSLRVEVARLRNWPGRLLQRRFTARTKQEGQKPVVLARLSSPMNRKLGSSFRQLEQAKRKNCRTVVSRLDRLVIQPHEVFSYHTIVGRPSLLRGFRFGLELHNEEPAAGVGGGACKVTNLIYQLALWGGMKIVERHRHSLDLFPDKGRTVPFGCGATVFYNYADLRFENPLAQPVQLLLAILNDELVGELRADCEPGWQADVYETDHRFRQGRSGWIRENRIRRRFLRHDGTVLLDEEVARNRARVLYEPHLPLPAPLDGSCHADAPLEAVKAETTQCCAQ